MSSSQQVYLTVSTRLAEVMPGERCTRRRNLALLVTALYLASSCALTRFGRPSARERQQRQPRATLATFS